MRPALRHADVPNETMAKDKSSEQVMRLPLLSMRLYRRAQGKLVRQVTMISLVIITLLIAWRSHITLKVSSEEDPFWTLGFPGGLAVLGLWISFRIVHMPRFADFLISVEAELNKVSWPSKPELIKSSIVVIVVIFLLAGVLYGYDLLWYAILQKFKIRRF